MASKLALETGVIKRH